MTAKTRTINWMYLTLLTACVLTACANNKFYRDGRQALENGEYVTGLKLLKQAAEQQPQNNEYKQYYYRQKESWVTRTLREADVERFNANWEKAKSKYQQVIEVEPDNQLAQDGLLLIESAKKNNQLMADATKLVAKEDWIGAQDLLRQVLLVDPNNQAAKKLLSKVQYQSAPANHTFTTIKSKFKKPVSLEFKSAPIKTVFELLSKTAGVNFILDKEIKNDTQVSVFVKNTTIDEALNNILSTTQLNKKILNENSVLIYPNSKSNEYEEVISKSFYLQNADPKRVQELIKVIVGSKDVFIDDSLKLLIVKDSPKAIESIAKLIQAYDLDDPEVILEVEILELSSEKMEQIGIQYPSQVSLGVTGSGGTAGSLTLNEAKHLDSNLISLSISNPAFVLNLNSTISANDILANPHIRVRNHKKAKVHIGQRLPVITNTTTATGIVAQSVNYLDVGLKLDVEPAIMVDDNVAIEIGLEVSNIVSQTTTPSGSIYYTIGTRNTSTSLKLKNGETQILAGLINKSESTSASRVPGVADLPIIGRLFANKNNTRSKTEIVLLITPKIVRNINIPEPANTEFSLGTGSGNAAPGMAARGTNGLSPVTIEQASPVTEPANISPQSTDPVQNPVPVQPMPLNIPAPPPLPGAVSTEAMPTVPLEQ